MKQKATLIGLTAILLWSAMIGLIRSVTEAFGPAGGAALIYTVGSLLLLITVGFPKLSEFSRTYLLSGCLLFVSYEILLSLSLGYAHNGRQTIEVGMVNYLWPSLTIFFAVIFKLQKASWLIIPGLLLALIGLCWVLGGDEGLNVTEILRNIKDNPLSYGMALAGALIWASYCTITAKMAKGKNGLTLFFMLTALGLWCIYFLSDSPPMRISLSAIMYLMAAAAVLGVGYAAWNIGILHGSVTVLATASYFIPVFSVALSAIILSTPLFSSFWQGALMVCTGSLLCWLSTRNKAPKKPG